MLSEHVHCKSDQQGREKHPRVDRFPTRPLTQSWLLSLFFDCPQNMDLVCPSPDTVARMERAIRRGQVTWHAMPFNAQVELFDKQLLNEALNLTLSLDEKFDLPPKITMSQVRRAQPHIDFARNCIELHVQRSHSKLSICLPPALQRDVPGLTSAAIPILKSRGVKGISVGVNGASAPPRVPHNRPFFWKDPGSKEQLIALWHPGELASSDSYWIFMLRFEERSDRDTMRGTTGPKI